MPEQVEYKILAWGSFASPALVLIFQWIGIAMAARSGRTGAWWCMFSGTLIAMGALLARLGAYLASLGWFGWGFSDTVWGMRYAGIYVSWVGALLFAVGFVLFAHRVLWAFGRANELESVCVAMTEEMGKKEERIP